MKNLTLHLALILLFLSVIVIEYQFGYIDGRNSVISHKEENRNCESFIYKWTPDETDYKLNCK